MSRVVCFIQKRNIKTIKIKGWMTIATMAWCLTDDWWAAMKGMGVEGGDISWGLVEGQGGLQVDPVKGSG